METIIANTDTSEHREEAVARAVELLARGEVIALPTETVYGLAADATRPDAVLKIFEAKERPFFDPLIVHLPGFDWLERVAVADGTLVKKLVETFWPGPLTLVLPRRELVPDVVTSGLPTVAVRMSAHPVFQEVIKRFGKPLAAPSANRFGRISPTAAEHVFTELNGRIPLIVDGGATTHGIESTIVAVENQRMRILRSGPITPQDLIEVQMQCWRDQGKKVTENDLKDTFRAFELSPGFQLEAPGQLKSHYAPRTPLLLVDTAWEITFRGRAGLLASNPVPPEHSFAMVEKLSESGDLREAAATLFAKLRRLDEAGLDAIIAERVPETGLGIAIMDRLRKAATKELPSGFPSPPSA